MSERAARYRRVSDTFGARVAGVDPADWDGPAPCEGWVARDVVGHLIEWLPAFFFPTWGLDVAPIPAVDDDPVAAWRSLDGAIRAAFDDPAVARAVRDTPLGPTTFEEAFDQIGTTDVFLHTWDLSRATGQDESLDPEEVRDLLTRMAPAEEAMRASGHFGPATPVPADADEQTRLLAFIGRPVGPG